MSKKTIWGIMVAIVVVAVGILVGMQLQKDSDTGGSSSTVRTITGKIVCLPKPGNGPQTLECAFGLQADDHKYYSLRNNTRQDIPTSTKVRVKGTVSAPSSDEIYDIDGVITVQSVETVE